MDAIHNAIAENKQISFQYFHHDTGKKKVYSNKGEKVFVSPWALIYTDDNYYLLAFHTQRQEFRHYRVDRMDKVEKAMYDREGQEAFAKVDMAEYTKYTFSMYRGDKQPVTMRFTNDMVDAVMDRFGRDVLMLKADDRHFEMTAVVSVSPQFFGWVFGLGNKVEIIRPDDVREQMKDVLKQTLSKYDDNKIDSLLQNKNIIRNKLKIKASITNSKIFMDIQKEYKSFSNYIWGFTNGNIIYENDKTFSDLSDKISRNLKKRGMRFVGTTIVYSYLQAIGVINSHDVDCYLYEKDNC